MVLHRPVKLAAFTTHLDLLAGCSQSIESRSQARRSLPTSRLLVTYLDRDMELVWTPKHFGQNELAPEFVGSNQASATNKFFLFGEARNQPN
jgi:hypothetical protein